MRDDVIGMVEKIVVGSSVRGAVEVFRNCDLIYSNGEERKVWADLLEEEDLEEVTGIVKQVGDRNNFLLGQCLVVNKKIVQIKIYEYNRAYQKPWKLIEEKGKK